MRDHGSLHRRAGPDCSRPIPTAFDIYDHHSFEINQVQKAGRIPADLSDVFQSIAHCPGRLACYRQQINQTLEL
ncbi:hypothetical protein AVEN_242496-1, partial [Araneus ventricosus]